MPYVEPCMQAGACRMALPLMPTRYPDLIQIGCARILAPATYIFFASAIPALTFGEQLYRQTGAAQIFTNVIWTPELLPVCACLLFESTPPGTQWSPAPTMVGMHMPAWHHGFTSWPLQRGTAGNNHNIFDIVF